VEHAENVVVGLHKEFGRVGEGLVLRKPSRMGMPVRANDGERPHMLIKRPGYSSCARLGRKQTVWMDQHDSNTTLSLRIDALKKGAEQ
jgi:hypothetical protein